MNPSDITVAMINVFSMALADIYEDDQLELLAAMFSQIGDTLATISIVRSKQASAAERSAHTNERPEAHSGE